MGRLRKQQAASLDQAAWDRQYAKGHWDFLDSLAEMPRYGVIAGYCRAISPTASILDIGCGTGLLWSWLANAGERRYYGIDLAETAIRQAQSSYPNVRFEVADAETFDTDERFDAIVLNEILYYLQQPGIFLDRCARFLQPGGRLILSMYGSVESRRAWRRCAGHLDVIDQVKLIRPRGNRWIVRSGRPRQRGTAQAFNKPNGSHPAA